MNGGSSSSDRERTTWRMDKGVFKKRVIKWDKVGLQKSQIYPLA